jgi:serine/threonine-protein kinase
MNREEYQQVKKIFQAALDIAPDERAEFLSEKCSDNPELRREVEKLLDSFDSEYLEKPAIGKVAKAIVSTSNLSVGQEIGHYRIIKKIGAGGMGEVFLAEDVRLKRKIALKILPAAVSQNKLICAVSSRKRARLLP